MATGSAAGQRFRVPTSDERASRRKAAKPSKAHPFRQRYAVVYDIEGPLVRLGILWFLTALAALTVGPLPTALLYGAVAALAAFQVARAWLAADAESDEPGRARPNDVVAAGLAGGMALGACLGAGGAGLVLLVGAAAALLVATGDASSENPTLSDAGWTLQCALLPGLAAMSMVLLVRLDPGSAIALLLVVSAYETGDYIVGSGATNPYEGPAAGLSALVVVTFIISTLPISSLDFAESWLFGGFVAVLAPAGQLVANAMLPAAWWRAPAMRRLDSLMLAAPVWCAGVGLIL